MITVSEAKNELVRFKNTFRAAEYLEQALEVVTNLEGLKAQAEADAQEAEKAKAAAQQIKEEADAKIENERKRLDKMWVEVSDEEAKIDRQKAEVQKEFKDFTSLIVSEKKKMEGEMKELTIRRDLLLKEVRELEATKEGTLVPSAQVRIEG